MSKYSLSWDDRKIKKYISQGRGQGTKVRYIPWLSIHDFPSRGNSSRILGWKTNRIHHFLSNNELRYFYLLEWSDAVVDIREQFPMLELDIAMKAALQANVRYPTDLTTGTPLILTTDFVITIYNSNKTINIARTIKPSEDLFNKRVMEKFEIERRYWEMQNIDWGIVTENEIDPIMAKNIEWVHSAHSLKPIGRMNSSDMLLISDALKNRIDGNKDSIRNITNRLDIDLGIEKGSSLYIFRHLAANKEITLDMKKKISTFIVRGSDVTILKGRGLDLAL